MPIPRISLKGQTINGRLLAWFLAISLIPCGLLAVLTSWLSTQVARGFGPARPDGHLRAKADELETYAQERLRWVTGGGAHPVDDPGGHPAGRGLSEGGGRSPESRLARDEFRPILAYVAESFGYPNLLLFSPRGDVLFRLRADLDPGRRSRKAR